MRSGTALGGVEREKVALARPAELPSRPGLVREVLLLAAVFLVYRLGRLAISGHDDLAIANAWHVWDVERFLRLPDEETLQDWALQWPDLLKAANWYYVGVHFPITLAFLAWGWLRRAPAEYRWARRLIITLTGFAMVLHVAMPLAPPRMLSSLGFLDTMAAFGPSAYSGGAAQVANQFAAMPSLHVGWAMLIAVVVVRTAKSRWRWGIVAHPVATTAVVVLTANHYWVDALVAAVLLGLVLLVTPRPANVPPSQLWIRLTAWARRPRRVLQATPSARLAAAVADRPEPAARSSVTSCPPRPRAPADVDS